MESDPNRDIDDLLDRWARWRRGANSPPTGGYGNPLAGLYAEASEIARHSKRSAGAMKTIKLVRASLRARIKQLRIMYDSTADIASRDAADRLQVILSAQPSTVGQLPYAALTHGSGMHRSIDYPVEEAIELAISRLPKYLRSVIKRTYLGCDTQEHHAQAMKISRRTFQYRLRLAKIMLRRDTK